MIHLEYWSFPDWMRNLAEFATQLQGSGISSHFLCYIPNVLLSFGVLNLVKLLDSQV